MVIVPLEERFIAAVARLERLCFGDPWKETAIRAEIANPIAQFFCCVEGDILMGYAGMHCVVDECYIANIAVDPEHRRKGVAKALINRLIGQGISQGAAFITLEVRESNQPALALYSTFGFEPVGRRPGYYTNPTEAALLMTKVF